MNLLLNEKYKYIVFESVDTVRSQLESIVKTPWYDIDINLAGKVCADNSFKLYSKLSLGVKVFGAVRNLAIIKGRLESKDAQTHIYTEVKPPDSVLFAFYFIVAVFLFRIVSVSISNTSSGWPMVMGLFFLLVFLRSLIYFSMGRLKNRFERIMLLHPEE